MKKVLVFLTIFLMTITLVGCNNPTDDNVSLRIEELEDRIEVLENRIDNMVGTVGLNGQVDWYENKPLPPVVEVNSVTTIQLAKTETDYLDKSKFPNYIFGVDGEYITIDEMVNMLCVKYVETSCTSTTGFQFKIHLDKPETLTNNDFMVRISMMIIELSHYDFYTIDSPELYIEFTDGGSQYMKVRMSLLVDDKYSLHPAIFWNGLMDTRIVGISFSELLLDGIYDDYIANGTFDGYVLPNYE